MSAHPEAPTTTQDIRTSIDPRLIGMAASYNLEVSINEDALRETLSCVTLAGTEPQPLELKAALHRGLINDVYRADRVVLKNEEAEDGETEEANGGKLTVYWSQRDIKHRRDHQRILLPALKKVINIDNPE